MEIQVVESLGEPVGRRWFEVQNEKTTETGQFFVAAPLSSTPLPVFEWVVANASHRSDWDRVSFVLMDEQLEGAAAPFRYIDVDDAASYEGFARKHLLGPLAERVSVEVPVVKPDAADMERFATRIDLLILAIGIRGNFANVMPGTDLGTSWHVAHLTDEFRQVHTAAGSASFGGATFREYGMSLGPQQVLDAGEVVVIASGARKRDLVRELVSGSGFRVEFPISAVHERDGRRRTTLVVTADAMPAD